MIKSTIADYIQQENLADKGETIIIGLSGGADSVALLVCLKRLGYNCIAAHCNFHLRAEESNRDQKFVENLCKAENTPLYIQHFNTTEYASTHQVSIEMAARELRYTWFNELINQGLGSKIAIGHHRDDNIETLLLNIARGTGLRGLTGIRPINGAIIRPLLSISRNHIESFLKEINQEYVTDSTNLEDEYARNKVRLHIIPILQQINSASLNNIENTINYLREVELIYNASIQESTSRVYQDNKVDIELLQQEVSPQTVLYEICYPLGFNSSQIEDLYQSLDKMETKSFLSKTHTIHKNRNTLYIQDAVEDSNQCPPEISIEIKDYNSSFHIPREKQIACFDADKINPKNLSFSKWSAGDSFVPFGMSGHKNLSDFFTDNKYTPLQKQDQWLLKHNSDIIWVVGERTDNRFRVKSSTKRVLVIKIIA